MQSTATIANTAAAMTMLGPLMDSFRTLGIDEARRKCCGWGSTTAAGGAGSVL
jgi:hypothetical protein